MSLLTIAQGIADRIGIKEITSVISNQSKNERQILSLVEGGGRALVKKTNSQGDGWSVLTLINEFTTTAGQEEYDLPQQFDRFVQSTAWQKDKYWSLRGSLSGRAWERRKNQNQSQGAYNVFRIFRTQNGSTSSVQRNSAPQTLRKFHITPDPGDGITIVYEYNSRYFWVSEDGTEFKETATKDTDESLFGDELHILDGVWRFKAANARNFAVDLAAFEDYRDTALVQDMAAPDPIPVGRSYYYGANSDDSDVSWCP